MPACITCKIGPESLSLPAGLWIIDASVRGTREEAHRVGHSQRNELPGLGIEHFDGVGVHRSIHRCVFSQAEGIMQIHVSKVALVGMKDAVGVCRIIHSIQSPTLGAALAGGLRISRALAHAAVESREMAAGTPVLPYDTMAAGVNTAGSIYFDFLVKRRFIELGVAGRGRVRSLFDPHEPLVSASDSRYPKTAILRVYGDGICAKSDPMILGRLDWLIGLSPSQVDLAVPIRVDNARAPALGSFGVMGLVPGIDVDPRDPATDPK